MRLKMLWVILSVLLWPHLVYGRYCVQLASDTSLQHINAIQLNLGTAPQVRVKKIGALYKLQMGDADRPAKLQPILEEMRARFPDAFIQRCDAPSPRKPSTPSPWNPAQNEMPKKIGQEKLLLLSLPDLGYKDDVTLFGVNPEISFYMPIYKHLRGLDTAFKMRLPSVLDRRSSVSVYIDGTPVFTRTLQEIGFSPVLNLPVRLSKGKNFSKITVKGTLFVSEDVCQDLPSGNLWMVLEKESFFKLSLTPSYQQIEDFFKDYEKRFHIVLPSHPNTRLSAVSLPYTLHKIYPGENVTITFSDSPLDGVKNIVIGEFQTALALKNNTLYLSKEGVSIMENDLRQLFLTENVISGEYSREKDEEKTQMTFAELGQTSMTQTGLDDIVYTVPVKLSRLGGLPSHLSVRLIMSHTPMDSRGRGFLKVFLNGGLVKAFDLMGSGEVTTYDVALPKALPATTNFLSIVSSDSEHGACKGSPSKTATLFDNSVLSWKYLQKKADTVSEFLNVLSGRVLLLVDQKELGPYAMRLADKIGAVNQDIKTLDVQAWAGQVPDGYDYVIMALHPENTKGLNLPLKVNASSFEIVNPLQGKPIFRSSFWDSFGILQVTQEKKTPVLLMTYYMDKTALRFLDHMDPANLLKQTGNIVIFRNELMSYQAGKTLQVAYPLEKAGPFSWDTLKPWVVILAASMAILFLIYVFRRLTGRKAV